MPLAIKISKEAKARNVNIIFKYLLPNTTAIFQPIYQGVIGKLHRIFHGSRCKSEASFRREIKIFAENTERVTAAKIVKKLIPNVLSYTIVIWGLRHCEKVEVIHTIFVERVLGSPSHTQGNALRRELGRVPLAFNILKMTLN